MFNSLLSWIVKRLKNKLSGRPIKIKKKYYNPLGSLTNSSSVPRRGGMQFNS
jgi:hypothetical protein